MYYNIIKIKITYLAFRNENSLSYIYNRDLYSCGIRENLIVYSIFNEQLKKSSTLKFRN